MWAVAQTVVKPPHFSCKLISISSRSVWHMIWQQHCCRAVVAAGQLARLDGHRRAAGKKSLGQRSHLGTATTTLIGTETRFLILNKTQFQFQTRQTFLSLSAQWAPTAMLKTTGCLLCCIAKSTAFKKTTTRQIQNPNGFLNECLEDCTQCYNVTKNCLNI
jgi:hypothetical protein